MSLVMADTEGQGERALVLVCGAVIDRALEKLLRLKFTQLSGAPKEDLDFFLIDQPVPVLGSAGIRVKMAKILGVIDRETCKALKPFFQIRNRFAHDEMPEPLREGEMQELFDAMPTVVNEMFLVPCMKGLPPRWLFQRMSGILLVSLAKAQSETTATLEP